MGERRFGPKAPDHPSVGRPCPLCGIPFEAGDYTSLVPVEPADDEERAKMESGRVYTARAAEVHWTCAHCFERLAGVAAPSTGEVNDG